MSGDGDTPTPKGYTEACLHNGWPMTTRSRKLMGNGAAMRIAPVGWLFDDYHEVLQQAQQCTICSHMHKEAIRGAQCVATVIYWLRTGRVTKRDWRRPLNVASDTRFRPCATYINRYARPFRFVVPGNGAMGFALFPGEQQL